uniref:F-box protein CPR30-like n=1 Tax=Nicotiana tabacum TaxID=4097 RepID=A0A1S3Y8I2_TOBAC|nr:PREDICTED: F-box protein CPR30-like [Nicotiana tabacum]
MACFSSGFGLLIWNPSTGESILLPHSENFICDEYQEESAYGLGYDSTTDDYKVIRIDMSGDENANEILALKSGSWRKIDQSSGRTDSSLLSIRERLTSLHGAFNWLGILSRLSVVTFNISDEMYGEIALPETMCLLPLYKIKVDFDVGVSVLRGKLCVYYTDERIFNLWVMKDYGVKESWTKFFVVPNNGIKRIIPIYMFSDGEVLLGYEDWRTLTKIEYRIISGGSVGLSNRMWPLDCDDTDAVTIDNDGIDQFVYTESLISPKLGH